MRTTSMFRYRRGAAAALGVLTLVAVGGLATADDRPVPPAPPPAPAPLDAPPPSALVPGPGAPVAPPGAEAPRFTREQLLELVGPVALYPDPVLTSLLPATAFPLDVVGAARWLREHGAEATPGPEVLGAWDPSVQGLVQFPDLLLWLDQNLPWLEQMGTAVAVQQGEVMEAIQEFRRKAKDAGNLKSDEHQNVVVQPVPQEPGTQIIVIEPAVPSVVYIPYYDPWAVCYPSWGGGFGGYGGYGGYGFGWSLGFTFGSWGPWCHYSLGWGWYDDHHHHHHGSIHHHDQPHYWFHRNGDADVGTTFQPRTTSLSRGSTTGSRDGQVSRVRGTTRPDWSKTAFGGTTMRNRGDVTPVSPTTTASTGLRGRSFTPSSPAPDVAATDRGGRRGGSFRNGAFGQGGNTLGQGGNTSLRQAGNAGQGTGPAAGTGTGATTLPRGSFLRGTNESDHALRNGNGGTTNANPNSGTPWRSTSFPRFRTDAAPSTDTAPRSTPSFGSSLPNGNGFPNRNGFSNGNGLPNGNAWRNAFGAGGNVVEAPRVQTPQVPDVSPRNGAPANGLAPRTWNPPANFGNSQPAYRSTPRFVPTETPRSFERPSTPRVDRAPSNFGFGSSAGRSMPSGGGGGNSFFGRGRGGMYD